MQGVMATNTYGDLCPDSRQVRMVLSNLSALEFWIPSKTVIGNVQMAEIVPDLNVFKQTGVVLLLKKQVELFKVSSSNGSNSPEKELTQPTPIFLQSGLDVPTPEQDVLKKVDLFGCAELDPMDQQEARKILREYADVFAKNNLNLGQTSVVKHKIALKEGAEPINECYRRIPPELYDEVQKHLQEILMSEL